MNVQIKVSSFGIGSGSLDDVMKALREIEKKYWSGTGGNNFNIEIECPASMVKVNKESE